MAALEAVPFDIWHEVAAYLEPQDYINAGIAIPVLRGALRDEATAKKAVRMHIPHTAEAKRAETGDMKAFQAVKRVYDIREAVATAQPFSASLVAYSDNFLFNQGKLCYIHEGLVRILDVHGSSQDEVVVNLQMAFDLSMAMMYPMAIMYPQDNPHKATFSLLSFADGHVVCRCRVNSREDYFIVLDARPVIPRGRERFRLIRPLTRVKKLWVRNNSKYVCVGTHSGIGRDCHREWLIQTIDLDTMRDVTRRPIQLRNFAGSDVGPTVSFEIKGDHLYAISNQTGFRDEEIDWTSYYICLRFKLSNPFEVQWQRIWRRQHREGPMSDMWTNISLQTDESTGNPVIVECRREWLDGASENMRTYYTQPLKWPEEENDNDSHTATSASAAGAANGTSPLNASMAGFPGLPAYMPLQRVPNDPLVSLLDASSKPNYEPPKKRARKHYHPEYTESERLTRKDFVYSKTKYSTYNHSASAFIDLVNDPPAPAKFFCPPPDRLRLRIGSRKRKSPIDEHGEEGDPGMLYPLEYDEDDGKLIKDSNERFQSRGIKLWPPKDAPRELTSLLCPAGKAGNVTASSDERCILYATTPSKTDATKRPIVLVSFDPSIRVGATEKLDLTENTSEEATSTSTSDEMIDGEAMTVPEMPSTDEFFCVQPAMHRSINRGYFFR